MKSDKKSISIVPCNPEKPEDFSRLSDAYSKLFNEKDNLRFLSLTNVPFDSHTISAFLKSVGNAEEVEYYVATSPDNKIIGLSTFENDLIKGFEVIGMVVDANYRDIGIGRALLTKGIEIARKKGFRTINISVFADNKPMLLLLIKMDFKPIKIEYHARFDGEDIIHLKKHI